MNLSSDYKGKTARIEISDFCVVIVRAIWFKINLSNLEEYPFGNTQSQSKSHWLNFTRYYIWTGSWWRRVHCSDYHLGMRKLLGARFYFSKSVSQTHSQHPRHEHVLSNRNGVKLGTKSFGFLLSRGLTDWLVTVNPVNVMMSISPWIEIL